MHSTTIKTTAQLLNTTDYGGTLATKTQKPSTPKTTNEYFITRLHYMTTATIITSYMLKQYL
jgi:hypothetical protein